MKTFYEIRVAKVTYTIKTSNRELINEIEREFNVMKLNTSKKNTIDLDKALNLFNCKLDDRKTSMSKILGFLATGILERLTIQSDTLLIHGSSIVINNKGYVFIGQSGAGKSTIIKNATSGKVLSDDTAILRKISNTWYIYRSPFDMNTTLSTVNRIILSGIFIIKKSKKESINAVTISTKLREIFRNDLLIMNVDNFSNYHFKDKSTIKTIGLLMDLTNLISIDFLFFKRNSDVAQIIPH